MNTIQGLATKETTSRVFLTGATGFVGKVVLTELIRRREELNLDEIFVSIRDKRGKTAQQRFADVIEDSPATEPLDEGWQKMCTVVAGDLALPSCGMEPDDVRRVTENTTHIIHCAASVDFDLPVADAARPNIDAALNVLKLAGSCVNLEAMVSVSTAYVTPFEDEAIPVEERPVSMPRSAEHYYRSIKSGERSEAEMLEESGHPNTYTFTKCVSEHLLMERCGDVPLRIVRPSVIAACRRRPHPGWIDSMAAYTGYLSFVGLGHIQAFQFTPDNRLDVIACDDVCDRIIGAGFTEEELESGDGEVPIIHAVTGREQASRLDLGTKTAVEFFSEHRVASPPRVEFIGRREDGFEKAWWRHQKLPYLAKDALLGAVGAKRPRRLLAKVYDNVEYMSQAFEYFSTNTFDFRSRWPLERDFDPVEYNKTLVRGIFEFLLKGDESELVLAGRRDWDQRSDLAVVNQNPEGNESIRTLAYVLRKFLNRCAERVTFNGASFRSAMAQKPEDAVTVIVPSHRSFLDFLLCSYLFFVRPELGVGLPHIPATNDFEDVAIVNWLFERARAFYIERDAGCAREQLNAKIQRIVDDGESLMFFPEGTRSRSRRFLAPRRGLLRALGESGKDCHLLPVTLTFDRVPEQRALELELRGDSRPKFSLTGLTRWAVDALGNELDIGRIHIDCAAPISMTSDSDPYQVADSIASAHQRRMAVSMFHLRTFVETASLGTEIDVDWLADAIEARGGRVLSSRLSAATGEPLLERSLRYHWMHRFYGDARQLAGSHPVVDHQIERNGYASVVAPSLDEEHRHRVAAVVAALFEPVAHHYIVVAKWFHRNGAPDKPVDPETFLKGDDELFLPYLCAALDFLEQREILRVARGERSYMPGVQFDALADVIAELQQPVVARERVESSALESAAE